ncbi:MAG: transposase [bacterium]|nr:transposase [bacterium]
MIDIFKQPHKGWYYHHSKPHFDSSEVIQFITFRLVDSLAQVELAKLEESVRLLPEKRRIIVKQKTIQNWLDAGRGCCALQNPELAFHLKCALCLHNHLRYDLLAWCIMPNHAHVLIRPRAPLGIILKSWKSFTSRWAMANNERLKLGISGSGLWMSDYFDRYIRSEEHLSSTINYIHNNPVTAGLCCRPEDWQWSSATELDGECFMQQSWSSAAPACCVRRR